MKSLAYTKLGNNDRMRCIVLSTRTQRGVALSYEERSARYVASQIKAFDHETSFSSLRTGKTITVTDPASTATCTVKVGDRLNDDAYGGDIVKIEGHDASRSVKLTRRGNGIRVVPQ